MKRSLILLATVLTFLTPQMTRAQGEAKVHRIAFHLASGDTLVHKMLMRNVHFALEAAPDARIEVVCHGPGLDMLMSERSIVKEKIATFTAKGVVFDACLNTMRERKIEKEQMIKEATFVPAAVIRLVELQEQGWSYIKAGF